MGHRGGGVLTGGSPVLCLVLCVALTGLGCGGAPEDVGLIQVDSLPGGAVRVTNALPEERFEPGRARQLVEELRVGAVDGEGPDVFGSIRSLALPLERYAPRVVEEERLTAVITDSLGVAYVVRMRLEDG